jgi:tetratricopeptide (TPR) repeat protein
MNQDSHKDLQILEEIERYWKRKYLNDQDEQMLAYKYKNDLSWRFLADEYRMIFLGIEEQALEDQLDEFHQDLDQPDRVPSVALAHNKRWVALLAAASVLLMLSWGSWLGWRIYQDKHAIAELYIPDPGLPSLMGVAGNYVFEKAMVDYKTKHYKEAIEAWETLKKMQPENDTILYFLGAAYLEDKQYDQASAAFSAVVKDSTSAFRNDALWYKGWALWKGGHKEDAIRIFEESEHSNKSILLPLIKE